MLTFLFCIFYSSYLYYLFLQICTIEIEKSSCAVQTHILILQYVNERLYWHPAVENG